MFKAPRYRRLHLLIGVTLSLIALAGAGFTTFFVHAAPSIVSIANTVSSSVASSQIIGAVPAGQQLPLTLTLHSRNQAGMQQFAQAVATPHSRVYHHYLTPAAFAQNFGADPAVLRQVEAFAQTSGLKVTHVLSGGLFVQVTGTAQQIQGAFHVKLNTYRNAKGQSFFANASNMSLPQTIAGAVIGVAGLEDVPALHRQSTDPRKTPPNQLKQPPHTTSAQCPGGAPGAPST